jgi:hypothetical protein
MPFEDILSSLDLLLNGNFQRQLYTAKIAIANCFPGEVAMKPFCAIAAILALAAPLLAHHSFAAEFDASQALRITGALTKIEWTNPHSYFYIDVKDEAGNITKWSCEAGSPGALSRRGFKRGDIKLGDTIIVDGYRAKDGSRLMDARRVTLPDGRIVSGASAGDGGPGNQ